MSSKGQGLSLNTIVIAAIVLVVLVILLGITTGYFGKWTGRFSAASDTCQGSGGKVVDKTQLCGSALDWKESTQSYPDVLEGKKCCIEKTCEERGSKCVPSCDRTTTTWPCKTGVCCLS